MNIVLKFKGTRVCQTSCMNFCYQILEIFLVTMWEKIAHSCISQSLLGIREENSGIQYPFRLGFTLRNYISQWFTLTALITFGKLTSLTPFVLHVKLKMLMTKLQPTSHCNLTLIPYELLQVISRILINWEKVNLESFIR